MDLSDYLQNEAKHCGCKTSQTWALDKKRTARENGSYTCLCESYCNRDAQYFVDRMLADKEKAEEKDV